MRSGFFNSEIIGYDAENMPVFDRAEEASFFAKYFSQLLYFLGLFRLHLHLL